MTVFDHPAVPGKQMLEGRAEGGPAQGEHKADKGQQQGEKQQGQRLAAVVGEDIGSMEMMQ